jgi:hypothetical protein
MNLLARCIDRPASELADFEPGLLLDLKLQAAEAVAAARAQAEKIDQALDIRYGKRAAEQRFAAGKDTGTVTLTEGPVRISCEVPKKVEWDQAALGKIVERIRAAGEEPAEFVEISYRVSESKYTAWPASMRASFDSARTLKPGKSVFRLSLTEGKA